MYFHFSLLILGFYHHGNTGNRKGSSDLWLQVKVSVSGFMVCTDIVSSPLFTLVQFLPRFMFEICLHIHSFYLQTNCSVDSSLSTTTSSTCNIGAHLLTMDSAQSSSSSSTQNLLPHTVVTL